MELASAPPGDGCVGGQVEDADWAGAVADPAVVADAWHEEVDFAEQFVAGSPDHAVRSPMQDGTTVALREVILPCAQPEQGGLHRETPSLLE